MHLKIEREKNLKPEQTGTLNLQYETDQKLTFGLYSQEEKYFGVSRPR
jgi:hypothetical protein